MEWTFERDDDGKLQGAKAAEKTVPLGIVEGLLTDIGDSGIAWNERSDTELVTAFASVTHEGHADVGELDPSIRIVSGDLNVTSGNVVEHGVVMVLGRVNAMKAPELAELSFPALSFIGSHIAISGCPKLTGASMPYEWILARYAGCRSGAGALINGRTSNIRRSRGAAIP